jgi:hypothetical protein
MPLKSANRSGVSCPVSCSRSRVVDQGLWVDLLLNVERRGVDDEVGPILLVLPAPDELRVEIAVALCLFLVEPGCAACIGHANRVLLCLL